MKHNGFNDSDFPDNPTYLGNNKNLILTLIMQYDTIQVIYTCQGMPHFIQTKIKICKITIVEDEVLFHGVIQSWST